jgi:protein-tyrosine-phosphatase
MSRLPQAVLFACTMNSVRSPMAEALLRRRFAKRIYVESVGLRKGQLDPFAVLVMDEVGMDISKHRPRSFAELDDANFDIVISLSPEAHHRALEMTRTLPIEAEYWPTFDPTVLEGGRDQMLEAYREVRDGLDRRIAARFKED